VHATYVICDASMIASPSIISAVRVLSNYWLCKYINYVTRSKIHLYFRINSIIIRIWIKWFQTLSKIYNLTLLFFLIDVSRIAVGDCGTQLNQSTLISFHKIPPKRVMFFKYESESWTGEWDWFLVFWYSCELICLSEIVAHG